MWAMSRGCAGGFVNIVVIAHCTNMMGHGEFRTTLQHCDEGYQVDSKYASASGSSGPG